MKFCKKCSKTLSILNDASNELCSECTKEIAEQKNLQVSPQRTGIRLGECLLTVTGSQIALHSPEGWLLWTGNVENTYKLAVITGHADRILAIRTKRKRY